MNTEGKKCYGVEGSERSRRRFEVTVYSYVRRYLGTFDDIDTAEISKVEDEHVIG